MSKPIKRTVGGTSDPSAANHSYQNPGSLEPYGTNGPEGYAQSGQQAFNEQVAEKYALPYTETRGIMQPRGAPRSYSPYACQDEGEQNKDHRGTQNEGPAYAGADSWQDSLRGDRDDSMRHSSALEAKRPRYKDRGESPGPRDPHLTPGMDGARPGYDIPPQDDVEEDIVWRGRLGKPSGTTQRP